MISIRIHLVLMVVSEFAGFAAGAALVIWLLVTGRLQPQLWLMAAALGGAVGLGVCIPRIVFRRLLPAKCPQPGCGGLAYVRGIHPIEYACRACGHVHTTHVYEGDSRGPSSDDL